MNEHSFARSLTKKLRERGRYVWKINANFAAGVPDMWVCGDGGDIWCELKWTPELPKRDSTPVIPDLSALQRLWLTERAGQAVRVCAIVATHSGCVVFDRPDEWVKGIPAHEARSRLLSVKDVAGWICGQTARKDDLNVRTDSYPPYQAPAADRRAHEAGVAA